MSLIKYIGSNIEGECLIDDLFKNSMDAINDTAKKYSIIVVIVSAKRNSTIVPGAIVTPAQMSNHLVGHAIDCNLKAGSIYYNSKSMQITTGIVKDFIDDLKALGLRWGGDFHEKDPVHFDDGTNFRNPDLWHKLNDDYNNNQNQTT